MGQISSRAKGAAQAQRLQSWIATTPLDEVPRNQFGGVARRRICVMLAITPSTVTSNRRLSVLFDSLDASIAITGASVEEPPRHGAAIFAHKTLLARCEQLENEVRTLSEKLRRLEHMTNNGWSLP
jgi:hypothetical protein